MQIFGFFCTNIFVFEFSQIDLKIIYTVHIWHGFSGFSANICYYSNIRHQIFIILIWIFNFVGMNKFSICTCWTSKPWIYIYIRIWFRIWYGPGEAIWLAGGSITNRKRNSLPSNKRLTQEGPARGTVLQPIFLISILKWTFLLTVLRSFMNKCSVWTTVSGCSPSLACSKPSFIIPLL